jgi:nicotinamidase-related amidase
MKRAILFIGCLAAYGADLELSVRTRVEAFKGSGEWEEITLRQRLPVRETGILICDMWNDHWCKGAARRVDILAGKMAPLIERARAAGIQIIHSPSDVMEFYREAPQRQRILKVAAIAPPQDLPLPDPPLPIDDSDGGCDTAEKPWHKAWSRQHAAIRIADPDVISDDGRQIYSFLREKGIRTLLVMGVHTNMCVLNRSFAIKQMTRWGIRTILVRDLTDAMYDPKDRPHVSHEQGTELVIQHIEKHWCPSIVSSELLRTLR